MIVARAPFRISFAGGGSDLRAYYSKTPGAVLSVTICSHMFVTVNRAFDDTVRVSYSKTEIVDNASAVKHDLVREAMGLTGIERGVEVTTIADVPAGTGLGSSSSLSVALLQALYAYRGQYCPPERLASEACRIEIDIVKQPIGKQDQYAAAYGGMNYFQFNPDESVSVERLICLPETLKTLETRLVMFYLGTRGGDSQILSQQTAATSSNSAIRRSLDEMVEIAGEMKHSLERNDLNAFASQLDRNWLLKKSLNLAISNSRIDHLYQVAQDAGSLGGKVLGAGGNGFLLSFAADGRQDDIRTALCGEGLREYPVRFEHEGSRIIFFGGIGGAGAAIP